MDFVRESLGVDYAKSLRRLALPEGRSVRCILFLPVDSICHPGGTFLDAIRAQGSSPPIVRDRAGAIRPGFSVCFESRAR